MRLRLHGPRPARLRTGGGRRARALRAQGREGRRRGGRQGPGDGLRRGEGTALRRRQAGASPRPLRRPRDPRQHPRRRPDLDVPEDGRDERRDDERGRLEARRQAGHRRPLRHDREAGAHRPPPPAHHLRGLPPREPRLRPRAPRRAPRPPAEPVRGHLGPLRGDGRHPASRRPVHRRSPGPPRLRHGHGRRPGHVPAHLPHPRDARRALLRPDLRVPLELLGFRPRGARS